MSHLSILIRYTCKINLRQRR